MGKKKKSKDEIVNLIRSFWTRKRANRPYTIPTDYILALADQIWRTNPAKAITFNTLKDLYCKGFTAGYQRKGEDSLFFRAKREARIKEDFDKIKDAIDDIVHNKNQQKTA
jgi:hypothetical protein